MTLLFLDKTMLFGLNSLAGHSSLNNFIIITLAEYLPYVLIGGFALYLYLQKSISFNKKLYTFAFSIVTGFIARVGIASPIRFFFPRPRPFVTLPVHQLIAESSPGFPSAHALFFFAFSTVVYMHNKKLGLLFFFLSVVICLARVAAGVHYPSDVLVGAILGTLCGFITMYAARRMNLGTI